MNVLHEIRGALAARVTESMPDVQMISVAAGAKPPAGTEAEVLLTYPWASANLAKLLGHGVRWIHTLGTGVDAFPFQLLNGQTVTCSRGASAIPISEWAMAVMLAFEKQLPESWIRTPPPGGRARPALGALYGRSLGLIGFGGIGVEIARRALPFGMRVRALRRSAAPSDVAGVEIVPTLTDLVATSDHIVIAAPSTPATRHLFNRATFAAVKRGAHLVNVARGALIDQDALREALDDGRIAIASLDAVDPEPLPEGHWMYTHPHVRLSPHISWNMPGAADLLIDAFVENLRRYRAGEPLLGVVDVAAGY
jgi:phosphoglycerate dehydrogenase-like enzyme